jgi:hypothetical protein
MPRQVNSATKFFIVGVLSGANIGIGPSKALAEGYFLKEN